jgi:3-methyladenine DNA glycosylase AlkD
LSSKNEAPRAKARGFLDDSAPVERNPAHRASIPGLKTGVLSRRDKKILYILATSKNMWKRRIAIVSTFYFIRNGEFNDSLNIAKILLTDKEDLLHKATGWMLREVGKRSSSILENFLNEYYTIMPRTMLRYAIERFSPAKRKAYLEGKIKAY